LHGTSGVCLPVAILVGPIRPRAIKDCVGDLLAGVAGHSHPNRDIGIPARGIDRTGAWLLTHDLVDVPAVDRCERQRFRTRRYSVLVEEVPLFLGGIRRLYPQHFGMVALGFATGLRPSSLRPLRRRGLEADVRWERGWCSCGARTRGTTR
jgi:hypothetical protein